MEIIQHFLYTLNALNYFDDHYILLIYDDISSYLLFSLLNDTYT